MKKAEKIRLKSIQVEVETKQEEQPFELKWMGFLSTENLQSSIFRTEHLLKIVCMLDRFKTNTTNDK